jgi:hypothetical protein
MRRVITRASSTLSVGGSPTIDLADDVSHTFRPHLGGVLAIPRNFAMVAGPECCRPTISVHRDLAAQHHDAHIEITVRMHLFVEVWFLATVSDLEALTPQIAFERFARELSAVATAAR